MKLRNKLITTICLIGSVLAFNTHAKNREEFRAAFEACISETGASKPAPGVRPSEEDQAKVKTCLETKGITRPQGSKQRKEEDPERKAFHEAVRTCAEENGIQRPSPGERPSDEDRSKIDACLSAKGISRPDHAKKASVQ